ncbi:MAG: hypothetical protein HQL37_08070 [Alphaproteobacteria bacterium]|nr:hypothetical protein [Alphaproteobacteria bacterium]
MAARFDDPDNPLLHLDQPPLERGYFSDEETVAATGLQVASLRMLQAAGAVRAISAPKHHGGYRRMWPALDVYKAAVAGAMAEDYQWNIKITGTVVSKLSDSLWQGLVASAQKIDPADDHFSYDNLYMAAGKMDWFFELVNRKLLFLVVPNPLMPPLGLSSPLIPMGLLSKDSFNPAPWIPDYGPKREKVLEKADKEKLPRVEATIKHLRSGYERYRSRTSLNISMIVRAAQRRATGLPTAYILDNIQDIFLAEEGGPEE